MTTEIQLCLLLGLSYSVGEHNREILLPVILLLGLLMCIRMVTVFMWFHESMIPV